MKKESNVFCVDIQQFNIFCLVYLIILLEKEFYAYSRCVNAYPVCNE